MNKIVMEILTPMGSQIVVLHHNLKNITDEDRLMIQESEEKRVFKTRERETDIHEPRSVERVWNERAGKSIPLSQKNLEPAEWAIANAIIKYCEKKIEVTGRYLKNHEYPEAMANIKRIEDQIGHLRRMQVN